MTDPPIQQHDDVVVVTGDAAALLYRAVHALAIRHHHDGVVSPPLLHQLRAALYRVVMSPQRHKLPTAVESSACCSHQPASDWCDTGEAAQLLGRSRRQVQRMCADPARSGVDAIRIGQTWMLHRAPLLVLAERRDRDRTDRLPGQLAAARRPTTGAVDRTQ